MIESQTATEVRSVRYAAVYSLEAQPEGVDERGGCFSSPTFRANERKRETNSTVGGNKRRFMAQSRYSPCPRII